jgi:hypothetical protein
MLKGILCVGAVALCLTTTPAEAQIVLYPPAAYIATTAPVYYQGHASYWYGNRWYYRNGAGWGSYDREPSFLRGRHAPARHFYGSGRGRGGGMRRR